LRAAIALTILVSVALPVTGETGLAPRFDPEQVSWQELRREDLGFRIELPGSPRFEIEQPLDSDFKDTILEVRFDIVSFHVIVREARRGAPLSNRESERLLDDVGEAFHKVMEGTSIRRFNIDGCPAREDRVEHQDDFRAVNRAVACNGRHIQFGAAYVASIAGPAVERFLASFALLPEKK